MAGTRWHNADGLEVPFGDYWRTFANFVNRVRGVNTLGVIKQLVIDVDAVKAVQGGVTYTTDLNNDGTNDGFNTGDAYLPAYSSVTRVTILVTEAFAGGTSISLGTFGLTGSAISATSLVTATEGVLANLDTLGARTYGAGALVSTSVETASVGAADAYVALTTAGTFTAGKAKILIEYIDPLGDA
jgi:hypothetical protein